MKRISDSWQRIASRQRSEQPASVARDDQVSAGRDDVAVGARDGSASGARDESAIDGTAGVRHRWWRLNDGQMQLMRYLVLLLAVGVVLMSLTSRETRNTGTSPADDSPTPPMSSFADGGAGPAADYARAVERQVADALLQMHGVGRVHVAVTVASGTETVFAQNLTTERRISAAPAGRDTGEDGTIVDERTTAQPVLVRSDQNRQEHPVVVLERSPVIQGVVVVTDAAADSRMRYEITRAVMTLLGLPAHRVYVLSQRW